VAEELQRSVLLQSARNNSRVKNAQLVCDINEESSSDQMRNNVVGDFLMMLVKVVGDAKRRVGKLHARQKFSNLRERESG